MSDIDYIKMLEQIYEINVSDFDISIQPLYMNDVISFDKNKRKIYLNSKYMKTPDIIRRTLNDKAYILTRMLNFKTLKPYSHWSKVFSVMFPMYKAIAYNQIALAAGPNNMILYFRKDGASFDDLSYHVDKLSFHKSIKEFLIPLIYKKDSVKPYEYISEKTMQLGRKVNDILATLGHDDKCMFLSESGLIFETDMDEFYIVSSDGATPKKGDKTSQVFLEFKLLNTMLNS